MGTRLPDDAALDRSEFDMTMIRAAKRRALVEVRNKSGDTSPARLIVWRSKRTPDKARVEFVSTGNSASIDYRDVLAVAPPDPV